MPNILNNIASPINLLKEPLKWFFGQDLWTLWVIGLDTTTKITFLANCFYENSLIKVD